MTIHVRTFAHTPGPRDKRTPSPQRARVLDYVRAEIDAGRPFPSHRLIVAHMGWKTTGSSSSALEGLRIDGWVVRISRGCCAKHWETVWRLAE